MKNLFFVLIISIAMIGLFAPTHLMAAEKIAIVDIKMIVENSLAAKNIHKQIDAKRESFQAEVSKEEDALRKKDQDLLKQRDIVSKEAFDQKATEFRTDVIEAQRLVQSRRVQLENAFIRAMKEVKDSTLEIISDLAKDKGFRLALPKSQTLYSDNVLEISSDVLKELNRRLPTVKIIIEDARR